MFDNTTRNMSLRKKIQLLDSKFEFAGGWLIGVGWVMNSVVNITAAVV